ncbi:hypothetical protein G1H11_09415 [Phytoactinopolyspora alkaliphila]|uniref:Uncharacterized protein n=1 Tax=Phytoactinopolyspora alkaliphila TaxID=1783498 RepID=A0A6N9YKE1_9ACTN|nr:hypothetical protein [Phytoactinopolyspora alkaliphila]NED95531.1 hypothetical protein [Phytoactinopolyspora alkaliphila]
MTDAVTGYGGALIVAVVLGVGLAFATNTTVGGVAGLAGGLSWLGLHLLARHRR